MSLLLRAWNLIRGQAAEPGPATEASPLPPGLERIVMPSARDRWRGRRVASYTQESIEQVLAGAFSGDLRAQWELFDLMEETSPRLAKDLNELKRAVSSLDWPLQPWSEKGMKPGDAAVARAKFCEGLIWKMRPRLAADENDFDGTLYDVLDGWGKGIAVLEMDFEVRPGVVARARRIICTRVFTATRPTARS